MRIHTLGVMAAVLAWSWPADAKPTAPQAFCDQYAESPICKGGIPACTMCHLASPPTRNSFGMAIESMLLPGAPRPLTNEDFLGALPTALRGIEATDADGDGYSNLAEILAGTQPGAGESVPRPIDCSGDLGFNEDWSVCQYDTRLVFKKLHLDFCGRSPTWEEYQTFKALPSAQQPGAIHAALDRCLDSEFWIGQDGQLWQLAHRKIKPLQAIKAGDDAGTIPLADYYDDYALFVYTQMDNHDVREVLTADYFITRRKNPTSYAKAGNNDPLGEQGVAVNRRAGMMTTRWNLVLNVMFTALPRTAAAQAYRSFLGVDIGKQEGIYSVEGEPVDYDEKGVGSEVCARCHATLDPLAYPFKNYQGLTGGIGTYDPNRIQDDFRNDGANITAMPEAGYIFGQPVADLVQWARVAADSDQFAKATVLDYWKLLLGHEVQATEQEEFEALWRDLKGPTHNYGVEKMLHALIETEAYGAP